MDYKENGALASQHIEQLLETNVIQVSAPIAGDQIQPASIDLRLGSIAYRVRSSFLPGKSRTVMGLF